jgi:hypothetical protein
MANIILPNPIISKYYISYQESEKEEFYLRKFLKFSEICNKPDA